MKRPPAVSRRLRTLAGPLVAFAGLVLAFAPARAASPGVVLNEVMYHPPDDRDELQWVELHNASTTPVDLRGWGFSKGFRFTFTNETRLAPGAFLVVCRDLGAFRIHYGRELPVVGEFKGKLSHGGETLELTNAVGTVVDRIRFADDPPWPTSPDGMAPSLERITVSGPGDAPANWAASPLPTTPRAAGTPGATNANWLPQPPPTLSGLTHPAPQPDREVPVEVTIADPDGVQSAAIDYQVLVAGRDRRGNATAPALPWTTLPLARRTGDDRSGTYAATLPVAPAGSLLRFRLRATDTAGAERIQPSPQDALPAYSFYLGSNTNSAAIPFAFLMEFGPAESPGASLQSMFRGSRSRRGEPGVTPARGEAALVYFPTNQGPVQLFDFIRITPRHGGWKVRLTQGQLVEGMSTVNVLFEQQPRFVLNEFLAYELFRRAGVPAPLSGHWRIWHNGGPRGYFLTVEQPNSTFLRRAGRNPDGDLYKILWYGDGVIGQHEKKNNPESGHAALIRLIDSLNESEGEAQWRIIEREFVVSQMAAYFAVNMCLQNWDGFFNNHFVYRSPGPTGRWEIFPWDEDKTWGFYDGLEAGTDWFTMPLTMGSAGDRPSGGFRGGGGPFGGAGWWRPGGYFSSPLLANPQFREVFRQRLRELCDTTFTPEAFGPVIDALEQRLEPEVRYRAQIAARGAPAPPSGPTSGHVMDGEGVHRGAEDAAAQFRRHIEGYRKQLVHRRAFILKELGREK